MRETSNYKLTQWDKTDRIEMEDFNSDNSKIDAALAAEKQAREAADAAQATALRSELAAEQTAREALAGQEAADVAALRNENCWVKLKEVTTGAVNGVSIDTSDIDWGQYRMAEVVCSIQTASGNALLMRLNNLSGNIYSMEGYGGLVAEVTAARMTSHVFARVVLAPGAGYLVGYTTYAYGKVIQNGFSVSSLTCEQIKSMQFFLESNGTFVAGSSIALYGLKK